MCDFKFKHMRAHCIKDYSAAYNPDPKNPILALDAKSLDFNSFFVFMIIKIVYLVSAGLASVIGVLGAPMLRTRALDVYDGNLEVDIRDYALVRRAKGRRPKRRGEMTLLRPPGYYFEATACPHPQCDEAFQDQKEAFTSPTWVNCHCIEFHDGDIPPGWEHPPTVPIPKPRGPTRIYKPGENKLSVAAWKRVKNLFPTQTRRLLAENPPPRPRYVPDAPPRRRNRNKRQRKAGTQCDDAGPPTAPRAAQQEVPQTQPPVTSSNADPSSDAALLAGQPQVAVPAPTVQEPHVEYIVSSPEADSVPHADLAATQHGGPFAAQHKVAAQQPVTDPDWCPDADHAESWKWWGNLNEW
jgi:hypothetical protein